MITALRGTTIARLRLHGDPARAAVLRTALELTDWPQPDGDAIVLVRRITVRGAAPRTVAAAAGARLAAMLRSAVPGESPSAIAADAVRFANAAALYAQLTRDLASGRAAQCWYWAHWHRLLSLPAARAIPELWCERPLLLGAIASELAAGGELPRLWRALPGDELRRLAQTLAAATGLPLPFDPAADDDLAPPLPEPPPALLARWQPVCRGLPAHDAGVRLALALMWLEWRPALAADASACHWLAQRLCGPDAAEVRSVRSSLPAVQAQPQNFVRRVRAAETALADAGAPPATDASATAAGAANPLDAWIAAQRDDTVPTIEVRADAPTGPTPSSEEASPTPPGSVPADAARSPLPLATHPAALSETDGIPTGTARREPQSAATARIDTVCADVADAGDTGNDWIDTDCGGLPTLLNVLNHRQVQALLGGARGIDAHGGGWHAWLALGRALGLRADDGVGRWLERRWQQHVGCTGDWQPRADDAPLLALAATLCGPPLWTPALIAGPGRLGATATHLDFERPLASVRLDVRRAGLDLDPGWLPWLGRVVTIHYRSPSP